MPPSAGATAWSAAHGARRGCSTASAASSEGASVTHISETQSLLRRPGAEIHLIGTAHISKESAEEVRHVLHAVRPDIVFVELDEVRAKRLLEQQEGPQPPWVVLQQAVRSVLGGGSGGLFKAATSILYQTLEVFGFKPGAEFKTALLEGRALGARIVCGDVPLSDTTARISGSLGFRDVLGLLFAPAPAASPQLKLNLGELLGGGGGRLVEQLKRREAVAALVASMEAASPDFVKALVHDRDEHMAAELWRCDGKVVAVVGLAHMAGIERHWQRRAQQAQPPCG